MYVSPNFKTKKALKEAIAAGRTVTVFQPNSDITGREAPRNGTVYLEGPHYPSPHSWYAQGTVENGRLVRVK
jgi:hypothetical protein